MKNNKKILLSIFFAFAILSVSLVSVSATAVGNVTFNANASAYYDEGTFFINWTNNSIDSTYRVFIFNVTTNALFQIATNNSATAGAGPWTYGVNYTNTTEGNYTFIVEAVNATLGNANSTNISMYVDRTAPTLTLPYTNATAKKNTENLTLNISVSDASSGLTGSVCIINVNGEYNRTIALNATDSTAGCNTNQLNLTGLSDGNKTIKIYVNDTVNILGLNNSFVVLVDTTAPLTPVSCSPTTVQVGDSFPCTCSVSDPTSGVNTSSTSSTSPDGTATPSSTGTFIYSCSATDTAGNSGSGSTQYTVTQIPSANSGGGGSSSTTSTITTLPTHTFSTVVPGTASVKKYTDPDLGIKEISINVNSQAQNVQISVTKYDEKPAAVSVEKAGKTFQYMQINVENVADKLSKATVKTQVKKSWVSDNGLTKENVALFKYDEANNKWNEILTTFDSEDDTYYYYTADLTSFSYFALGEKTTVTEEGEEVGVVTGSETQRSSNNTWIWIVLGLIVLAAAIGFGAKKMRK